MVKTYQLTNEGQFGSSLKVAPVSTNDFQNKETCLQVNGSAENRIQVQTILPDARNFSLVGTVDCGGMSCDKFKLEEVIGEKKNVYMLWVRYKKSPKYPSSRMPIPVRYEMKGYNTLLGSHFDHYYLEYDFYSHEDIPSDVFEVNVDEPCTNFPGPGHYATMNPMQEFIHKSSEHVDHEFERFKNKHSKSYDDKEHEQRKNIFRQNLRFIHSTNRRNLGFSVGVNHLADRTEDEVKALRGFKSSLVYNGGKPFPYDYEKEADHLPDQHDWRLFGAVSQVKVRFDFFQIQTEKIKKCF